MRFLKCVIFCFLLGSGGVRAASFDTSQVIFNAKLNIIPFNEFLFDSTFLDKVIKSDCSFRFLKSRGFGNMTFFEIEINPAFSDSFSQYMTRVVYLHSYIYCFGFNETTNQLIPLRGFHLNDFRRLYIYASMETPLPGDLKTKEGFCKSHFVEGLDLDCMYEYYFRKDKTPEVKSKYKCMKPNTVISTAGW